MGGAPHRPGHAGDEHHHDKLGQVGGQGDIYTAVISRLLAGPLTFGLIGFGLDRWTGMGFFLPIGLIGGMAVAIYVIWLRYGKAGTAAPGTSRENHGIEESK